MLNLLYKFTVAYKDVADYDKAEKLAVLKVQDWANQGYEIKNVEINFEHIDNRLIVSLTASLK